MFSLIAVLCLVKKPILRDSLQCSSFVPTLGYFFSFQFQISPLSMYKFTNDRVTPYIFKCIDTSLRVNRHSETFTLTRLSVVFKLACLDGRWKRNKHSWLIKSILMWFELVHSCGLRVVFEWLHGSDLGSYVVQTGSIGIEWLPTCGQSLGLLASSCTCIQVMFLHSAWLKSEEKTKMIQAKMETTYCACSSLTKQGQMCSEKVLFTLDKWGSRTA